MFLLLWCAVLLGLSVIEKTAAANTSNIEARLWGDLSNGYLAEVRPASSPNETIHVEVRFILAYMGGLDEKKQTMDTAGWVDATWTDPFLMWNPEDYEGLQHIVLPSRLLWLPELAVLNALHETPELSHRSYSLAKVSYTGRVDWTPSVRLTTACTVDLTFFPADRQRCPIRLTQWVYDRNALSITFREHRHQAIIAENFATDGEWLLENTTQWYETVPGLDDAVYPILGVTLYLKRYPRFYILNIVVPFLALGLLAAMVFLIPPDSGERISFGISAMVSFTLLLMFIMDIMPSKGDVTSILAMFAYACIGQSSLGLVLSILISNLHHRPSEVPVPKWINNCMLACMRKGFIGLEIETGRGRISNSYENKFHRIETISTISSADTDSKENCSKRLPTDSDPVRMIRYIGYSGAGASSKTSQQLCCTWKVVAHILDRTFFAIFLCVYILQSIIFFIALYNQPEHYN